jgi:phage-related protein
MNRKTRKSLIWLGSSKKDLIALSEDVQDVIGYGLGEAQSGRQASNAYVLKGFGSAGVLEIITHDRGGTYRGVYTVNFADIVLYYMFFKRNLKRQ